MSENLVMQDGGISGVIVSYSRDPNNLKDQNLSDTVEPFVMNMREPSLRGC